MNKYKNRIFIVAMVFALIFALSLIGHVTVSQASPVCLSRSDILKTNHDTAQRIKEALIEYIEAEQEVWASEASGLPKG